MLRGLHEDTRHTRGSANNLTSDLGTQFAFLLYDLLQSRCQSQGMNIHGDTVGARCPSSNVDP